MDNELKNSEQIKSKFIEVCTPYINQMSDRFVTNLNDTLKPTIKTHKLKQVLETKFKDDMVKKWLEEFDKMWNTKNMDKHISTLNELKYKHKEKSVNDKAWRAYGHTAEQQTQLSRNRLMSVHLVKMDKLLEKQSKDLQNLIFEVEKRRNYMNEVSKRRAKTMEIIDSKLIQLKNKYTMSDE